MWPLTIVVAREQSVSKYDTFFTSQRNPSTYTRRLTPGTVLVFLFFSAMTSESFWPPHVLRPPVVKYRSAGNHTRLPGCLFLLLHFYCFSPPCLARSLLCQVSYWTSSLFLNCDFYSSRSLSLFYLFVFIFFQSFFSYISFFYLCLFESLQWPKLQL